MAESQSLAWAQDRFSGSELELVQRAYDQAMAAHDGQMRASGEPYVVHSVEVARMLADLGLDHHVVAAGLLHDVVEDSDWTIEDIGRLFDKEVATLVDGVTKLAYIDTMTKMLNRLRPVREIQEAHLQASQIPQPGQYYA